MKIWSFSLFLCFVFLFCVVLWFFFLHSGQTSPYQNYPDHWASETISYAYPSKPDEKSAWSKKQKKRKQIKFMYFLFKSSNLHIILYGRICGLNNERLESWKRKLAGTAISNRPRQFPMKFISGLLSTTDWKIPIYWRHWLVLAQKNQTNPKHLFCSRFKILKISIIFRKIVNKSCIVHFYN